MSCSHVDLRIKDCATMSDLFVTQSNFKRLFWMKGQTFMNCYHHSFGICVT